MGQYTAIQTEGHINQAIADVLGKLLDKGVVSAVLVPCQQPHRKAVMQTLVRDPEALAHIDPFAPVVPTNSARLVATLTHHNDAPVAAVVRSCEVRAFLELVKLHQGCADNLLIIGIDCYGRYEDKDYFALTAHQEDLTTRFLMSMASGAGGSDGVVLGAPLANACRMCEYPVAEPVDIRLCAIGTDVTQQVWFEWVSEKGLRAMETLALPSQEQGPQARESAIAKLRKERMAHRDAELAAFRSKTDTMTGLADVVAACINCYNCRVACPACYCKECVFVTDTFRHDGEQVMRWAFHRGHLKMPTDTVFFHVTRMLHMSTLCVGCGQCSSACPNDIPVMELFRSVAERTQARFAYVPGSLLTRKTAAGGVSR